MRKIGVVVVYNLFPCLVQDRVPASKESQKQLVEKKSPKGPPADNCPLCPACHFCCSCVAWRSSSTL